MKQRSADKSNNVDQTAWLAAAILLLLSCWPNALLADHALTQDGTGLFNVSVEQTATTWSRPLRVRWHSDSFEYDYDRHQIIRAESEGSTLVWLADVITTEAVVGKNEARELMRRMRWHRYVPPPPRVVALPTPTPLPTATPTPEIVSSKAELADQSLPLRERLEKQREIFLTQQQALAEQLRFAERMHSLTNEEATALRKKLLERQILILKRYFPPNEETVQLTIEALEDQIHQVDQKGKFSWEF
ncbi:MAG: hypothetical protein ACPL7D_03130 [Candidatus Sumerlaeaceae bacterium]